MKIKSEDAKLVTQPTPPAIMGADLYKQRDGVYRCRNAVYSPLRAIVMNGTVTKVQTNCNVFEQLGTIWDDEPFVLSDRPLTVTFTNE